MPANAITQIEKNMARSKKTRNINENGAKVAPRTKKTERKVSSKKQDNGHKTGTRHNESLLIKAMNKGSDNIAKDPRHGSKRPIELTLTSTKNTVNIVKTKQAKLTDEQKLLQLEEDPRLNQLLDKLEEGKTLAKDDQQWLDKQLDKIETLLAKLGINEEDDMQQIMQSVSNDDDLMEKFESGADMLKAYQQKD